MVERGPYVSYANCGLPYHVGGVIAEESSLLVATEQMFRAVFNVDARTRCEATAISPKDKTGPAEEPLDGRGHDRVVRQLCCPPERARFVLRFRGSPARNLLGADRAGMPGPSASGSIAARSQDRDGFVHGLPDVTKPKRDGPCRRRVHRPRDGEKLRDLGPPR